MTGESQVRYAVNTVSKKQIEVYFAELDSFFTPSLSSRLNIEEYAEKISTRAERFEAWSGNRLVGMVNVYMNDTTTREAFITNVSVHPDFQRQGIAHALLESCFAQARLRGFLRVTLRVSPANKGAIKLYECLRFTQAEPAVGEVDITLVCVLTNDIRENNA